MHLQRVSLTLFTLVATLTISDFHLIQNPTSFAAPEQNSLQLFPQSQVLAQTPADLKVQAYQLFQQGIGQYQISQFEAALQSWQQALTFYQQIKDREGERKSLGNLGLAYRALGNYAKAIDHLQQTLDIAREIKDRQEEGNALLNLGVTYRNLGDHTKAIEYLQQTLNIVREIKDRQGEGNALLNLGVTYRNLGDYAKAIEYLQQTLNIVREIKDRQGEGNALGGLGNAYSSLGDYAKAIEYLQQQLAIAKEIHNRQEEGNALGSLGVASFSQGNYPKAIEYYQQWLNISREIKDRQGEGLALNNLGVALLASGELAIAEKTLIDGIKVRESLRAELGNNDTNKVSMFETQANSYRILQQALIAQNKIEAALEIAERGRARAFVELLASRLDPATAKATITPPTIAQIKQIAKVQNSTLVEYSIIFSELYIWVVKPTGELAFRKVNLTTVWHPQDISLSDLTTISREAIGVRGRSLNVVARVDEPRQAKQLQLLYKLLIQPIAELLPTEPSTRVIFIPQESLFLVPFAALKDELGKYLIEKYTILTAPSIQVLQLTHQERQRVGSIHELPLQDALVVGNPTMPSVPPALGEKPQPLPSLPGAEQEALAIAPILNTKPLIGKDATKTAIVQLMPKARIIHLATHGLLDEIQGIGSAIALAPSGKDNGLLTAEEILNLKLNADLVVLSACNTGRGRITGDGVIGLSRSLISAGVPSVLVSLWAVPDAPTASLMTEFYQNLQKNPDKAIALRQAMLTTMKQHPNPKDWAAFTLIGEAE
jgi:CHAT domain-containing protein/Flp pilus assembly protein TadD